MTKPRERIPGPERMRRVLGLRPSEREAALVAWLREDVEDTLASPQHIPVLPYGAREYTQRVANALRSGERVESGSPEGAHQHGEWMRELYRVLVVEGLHTAHELVLANEPELLDRMIRRLDSQARALAALDLAWWPQMSVANQRPVVFPEHVARGVRWLRDALAAGLDRFALQPHPALALAQAEAREVAGRLLGAGLDAVMTRLREPPADAFHGGQAAFHGVDPSPDPDGDEIVAPGPGVTETSQDDWGAP